MVKTVEFIGNAAVEFELKGAPPPRLNAEGVRAGREYGLVTGAIQDEFSNLRSLTIDRGGIRFAVVPLVGETIESLLIRARALQARVLANGILAR